MPARPRPLRVVRTVRVVQVRVLTLAQLWLRVLALLAKLTARGG